MTNVKEVLSLFRNKFQDFQDGKDYTVSFEGKGKDKKSIYFIHSIELKKVLREVVSVPSNSNSESFNSVEYKEESCDAEGNCFSYRAKKEIDFSSDELTITSGSQKNKIKEKYGVGKMDEDKETLTWEEIEQRRREVEKAREEVAKRRIEVEELRRKNLPTGDYYSENSKLSWEGRTWEKRFTFEPDTGSQKIEEIYEQSQSPQQIEQQQQQQQQTKEGVPLLIPFPKQH